VIWVTSDLPPFAHLAGAEFPCWRASVPTLINRGTRLRELRCSDAPTLVSMLGPDEVSRFITPPPGTVEDFEHFIRWSHRRRAAGEHLCLGIVPEGLDAAVGIFQLQVVSADTPEWGFAMGSPFWGTGLFVEGAEAMLDFTFRGLGIKELGARSAVENGRGNGALRKIGAVCHGVIPEGFAKDDQRYDEYYWTIRAGERRRKVLWDVAPH
jgi:RimJ/RimL family protein N-acetyltransferase